MGIKPTTARINNHYNARISAGGIIRWPCESSGLTPLDLLWGYIKNKIYRKSCATVNEFRGLFPFHTLCS